MKKFWRESRPVIILFVFWRFGLALVEYIVAPLWPLRIGFLGPVLWANLDGVHYLSIARNGYFQFEQAFFPLYPLLIRYVSYLLPFSMHAIAVAISNTSFFIGLWLFYKLFAEYDRKTALWAVFFLLLFPASFFFTGVYSEGLFFMLSVGTLFAVKKKLWITAGILGMFAGATRLFGVLLFPVVLAKFLQEEKQRHVGEIVGIALIPIGLLAYMFYLYSSIGDPIAFFHAQPAFGAGRSGEALIYLPQVLWRYAKIFVTTPIQLLVYHVAVFELLSLIFGLWLCWRGWKKGIEKWYIFYCLAVLLVPTFTGTLSSLPRYMLSAFPLFFVLGTVHNMKIKIALAVVFTLGLVYFASAYLSGYFVA